MKPWGLRSVAMAAWSLARPCAAITATNLVPDRADVLVVVGAAGESDYGSNFLRQASLWQNVCAQVGARARIIGTDEEGSTNDYDRLKASLAAEPKEGAAALWVVLIGHGTYDGKEAKFNLRGPDVTATELGEWLKPFHRPLAVLDTASSSAPFLAKLSATNRVVITATRSGYEQNFTHFGQCFAETISDGGADLDKDGQVSLLEAFLMASRKTAEFYRVEGRIASEHALLDDNGDGLGTPADWFRGLRAVKRARENAPLDGLLARQFVIAPAEAERTLTPEQRARCDALERAVLLHRERKAQLPEEDYYRELERLLSELAQIYSSNSSNALPSAGVQRPRS